MIPVIYNWQSTPTITNPFEFDISQVLEELFQALDETKNLQFIDRPFALGLTISAAIKGYNSLYSILHLAQNLTRTGSAAIGIQNEWTIPARVAQHPAAHHLRLQVSETLIQLSVPVVSISVT